MNRETMTFAEWHALGVRLYGEDARKWEFRCVLCGNVQSHVSVTARNPEITKSSNWIYYSCEGRRTPGVGCDWTLGGLFHWHKREVVEEGSNVPVFLFAAEPVANV